MQKPTTVNREKVLAPKFTISNEARTQIELMKKMDFTIEDKQFRVAIKGKECDGFTYEVYFDVVNLSDFVIPLFALIQILSKKTIEIVNCKSIIGAATIINAL